METIINSSYLITVGTLIGYERKMKCKELAGTKAKEPYKQIPFCEGICCVQTYRNIEKATLEVKAPIYEQFLEKLGYRMEYDDVLYKEINYRLQNLNDAIEKFELDSAFLIITKIRESIAHIKHDIYFIYLGNCLNIIYDYYHENKLPDEDSCDFLEGIYTGFPGYFKDLLIDLIYKYGTLNIIDTNEFFSLVERIGLKSNHFVPNRIDYLQYLCNKDKYDEFYEIADILIEDLQSRAIYLRIIDIYDLKTFADLVTNPTRIEKDLEECCENVDKLFKKLRLNPEHVEISKIPRQVRRKLEQHYYHMGYTLMKIKKYERAKEQFELSIKYDDVFETLCKVALFNCYDRLSIDSDTYLKDAFKLNRMYDDNNKYYIFHRYYLYKYKNENKRNLIKYLRKYVIDVVSNDDSMLMKILFYELNELSKTTSNYQILQEFIEKMGIID